MSIDAVLSVDAAFRRALSTVARNGHLISDWTTFCRYLDLSTLDIETLTYHYTGVRERCYHALMRWIDLAASRGHHLSVTALILVLRRSNSHKLAGMSLLKRRYLSGFVVLVLVL